MGPRLVGSGRLHGETSGWLLPACGCGCHHAAVAGVVVDSGVGSIELLSWRELALGV